MLIMIIGFLLLPFIAWFTCPADSAGSVSPLVFPPEEHPQNPRSPRYNPSDMTFINQHLHRNDARHERHQRSQLWQ